MKDKKRLAVVDAVSTHIDHECCLSFVPTEPMSLDPYGLGFFEIIALAI